VTFSTALATAAPTRGPVAGLAAQGVLLAVLAGTVGLSAAGVLAGAAYAVVLWVSLTAALQAAGMPRLGPANRVTLARASLVAGVTALVATSMDRPIRTAVLVTLVGVALALDGVDGQVARRTGSTSALGARFDMEIDAFLILVLSVDIAGTLGWWTVAIGAYRYLFLAASRAVPWLAAPLPPRFSRKVVAAVQGVALGMAITQLLPSALASIAVVAALASLTWSFGHDIGWLWRVERIRRAVASAVPVGPYPVPAPVA
jgi:phosphatidylglycerophosphate synthase